MTYFLKGFKDDSIKEEKNKTEIEFEPATEHISVRITAKEKRIFVEWCRKNKMRKSDGIRKLITERLLDTGEEENLIEDVKKLKEGLEGLKSLIEKKLNG
tara:strand:- start:392 stop:691 length:300 start_codon:yes stop_codon:yes gene_type:complete